MDEKISTVVDEEAKNIDEDIVQEKEVTISEEDSETKVTKEEKVETKSSKRKGDSQKTKKCTVLKYIERLNIALVSFDGMGFRIPVDSDPGKTLTVKYSGTAKDGNLSVWV